MKFYSVTKLTQLCLKNLFKYNANVCIRVCKVLVDNVSGVDCILNKLYFKHMIFSIERWTYKSKGPRKSIEFVVNYFFTFLKHLKNIMIDSLLKSF